MVAAFPVAGAWRVHTRRGALMPRPVDLDKSDDWNRFEVLKPEPAAPLPARIVPGSVYSATERRAAYAEVLAHMRWPRNEALDALAAEVFGTGSDTPVTDEWDELGFDPPGVVDADWIPRRQISRLGHRPEQEVSYVDVEHHESMATLNVVCKNLLIRCKAIPLSASLLRSTRRDLTCGISTEIATCALPLATGRRAAGFRYFSQHSTAWECWVTWPTLSYSDLQVDDTQDVARDDEDLVYILDLFHLHVAGSGSA